MIGNGQYCKLVSRHLFPRNFDLDAFATFFTIQHLFLLSLTTTIHALLFEGSHRDR